MKRNGLNPCLAIPDFGSKKSKQEYIKKKLLNIEHKINVCVCWIDRVIQESSKKKVQPLFQTLLRTFIMIMLMSTLMRSVQLYFVFIT